jgi:glycosyltransferase involved in cell wall biosynthesis
VVTFANVLDANKNPVAFVMWAKQILSQTQGLPVHFVIAGDGPEKPLLEAVINELQLQSQVHVVGYRTDMPELLAASRLYISLSQLEAFGLGMVEAMACGAIPLGFAVGGLPEVVGSELASDLLVPYGDYGALQRAAIRWLTASDETRAGLQSQLTQRAQTFEMSQTVTAMTHLFTQVITHHQSQPQHPWSASAQGTQP